MAQADARISILTAEAERERLRGVLDGFEARYGLPSDRLIEAFLDEDGNLVESDDWRAWNETWAAGAPKLPRRGFPPGDALLLETAASYSAAR
jgi:hypothetical protein